MSAEPIINYHGKNPTVTIEQDDIKYFIVFDDLKVDLLDSDPEERSATYIAEGIDQFGNLWRCGAEFSCGELEKLDDFDIYKRTENG